VRVGEEAKCRLPIMHVELPEDRGDVRPHRHLRNEQPRRDLRGRLSLPEKVEHLFFAAGERELREAPPLPLPFVAFRDQSSDEAPRQQRFAASDRTNREPQRLRIRILHDVGRGTSTLRPQGLRLVARHGENDHRGRGTGVDNLLDRADRVAGHLDLEQAYIRPFEHRGVDRRSGIARLRADVEIPLGQQRP
jgi:hypothetical protein